MGDAQAPPLADGMPPVALVATQKPAIQMPDLTLAPTGIPALRYQEAVVAVLGDEADLLAFRFVRQVQTQLCTEPPDLGLGEVGQGEEGPGQCGLGVVEEKVALVLGGVEGLVEVPASFGVRNGRIMARRNKGSIQRVGSFHQG